MKTVKIALIAIILSVGIINIPAQSQPKPIQVTNLSLQKAIQDPGLLNAMHAQLTMEFIKIEQPGIYFANVR